MSNKNDKYYHKFYKHCSEKEADGIAWVFIDEKTMVNFPFKFPELKSNEIRANILYCGLCASNVQC